VVIYAQLCTYLLARDGVWSEGFNVYAVGDVADSVRWDSFNSNIAFCSRPAHVCGQVAQGFGKAIDDFAQTAAFVCTPCIGDKHGNGSKQTPDKCRQVGVNHETVNDGRFPLAEYSGEAQDGTGIRAFALDIQSGNWYIPSFQFMDVCFGGKQGNDAHLPTTLAELYRGMAQLRFRPTNS